MIVQHIRNKQGHPVATLVAEPHGSTFRMGWSKCNTRLDSFNKKTGRQIAINRMRCSRLRIIQTADMPREVKKELPAFHDRCVRYFKVS